MQTALNTKRRAKVGALDLSLSSYGTWARPSVERLNLRCAMVGLDFPFPGIEAVGRHEWPVYFSSQFGKG